MCTFLNIFSSKECFLIGKCDLHVEIFPYRKWWVRYTYVATTANTKFLKQRRGCCIFFGTNQKTFLCFSAVRCLQLFCHACLKNWNWIRTTALHPNRNKLNVKAISIQKKNFFLRAGERYNFVVAKTVQGQRTCHLPLAIPFQSTTVFLRYNSWFFFAPGILWQVFVEWRKESQALRLWLSPETN